MQNAGLLLPFVDFSVFCIGNCMINFMLSPFLLTFVDTELHVGMIMLTNGVFYMIASLVIGQLIDKMKYPMILLILRNICMFVTFTIVGPIPQLPFNPSISFVLVALCFKGIADALMCISIFTVVMINAQRYGFANNVEVSNFLSSLWSSCSFLGGFVGPALGGVLVEHFDFRMACVFFWASCIVATLMDIFQFLYFDMRYHQQSSIYNLR